MDSFKEAMSLFLEGCEDMGTLEAALEEAGYHLVDGRWMPRKPLAVHQAELALKVA